MLSIGRSKTQSTPVATGGWADLLESEENHVARQGFGAGVLIINFAPELVARPGVEDQQLAEAAILAIIDRHLGWTDRTAMVAPGRLGVVMVPVDGALMLSRRARELHRDLRSCDLDIDVSYSIRRRSGGLPAAAARADAALDTAVVRRANQQS